MAIVKMKRLRLLGMRSDRERLLHLLQRLGCVEVGEPAIDLSDPEWAALAKPDGWGLANAKEQSVTLGNALNALKTYDKTKEGIFRVRPEVSEDELFDDNAYATAQDVARAILEGERNVAALTAEQGKLQLQKAALAPWLPLDVPLEMEGDETISLILGTIPAKADFAAVEAAVAQASELSSLYYSSADRDFHYFLLMCHVSGEEACLEALRPFGFTRVTLRGWTGTAADNDRMVDNQLAVLEEKLTQAKAHIASFAPERELLRRCADRAAQDAAREEAKGRLIDTDETFFLEGWVSAEEEEELAKGLDGFICAWETQEPSLEEYPDVPVALKNNWFTRPLSMVTDMYALPAYGSLDPNPLMAPFFIFFYGFMMADMGYGLLMMIASVVIMKKAKPKGPTMRHMIPLLGLCGISTFIMGALTGGFFGDLLPQLAMMLNPDTSFTALPALFSPLDDALAVLIGSLIIGLLQVFTGMGISMYKQIKNGEVVAALCNEGAWFCVFLLLALGILLGQVKAALIAIAVILVLTQGHGKKGIVGKITGIGGSLYNNITGYFSDILSYSRLMALMLAGAVIAQVFNTLGAITGNVISFFIIAMIGNTLNFALNLLSCYVHDMRLQCLEYFGRFYEDGGKPFRPLAFSTKYIDIEKE